MTNQNPTETRAAKFPTEYGKEEDPNARLEWGYVEEQIKGALNYWLASIGPSGAPHVRPVDGVWIDGALCFGGSPETRWVRNLEARPRVSINLPSDQLAVIMEGEVEQITDADHPLVATSSAASRAKYPQYYQDEAAASSPPPVPFWCFRPRVVYAWTLTGFPNKSTRWSFDVR